MNNLWKKIVMVKWWPSLADSKYFRQVKCFYIFENVYNFIRGRILKLFYEVFKGEIISNLKLPLSCYTLLTDLAPNGINCLLNLSEKYKYNQKFSWFNNIHTIFMYESCMRAGSINPLMPMRFLQHLLSERLRLSA